MEEGERERVILERKRKRQIGKGRGKILLDEERGETRRYNSRKKMKGRMRGRGQGNETKSPGDQSFPAERAAGKGRKGPESKQRKGTSQEPLDKRER